MCDYNMLRDALYYKRESIEEFKIIKDPSFNQIVKIVSQTVALIKTFRGAARSTKKLSEQKYEQCKLNCSFYL